MRREQAKQRVEELRDYYGHLAAFVCVNLFLIGLNLALTPDHLWFWYALFGWGIGLGIHTVQVFLTDDTWEERKIQELTGWQHTQDELDRLSERTDNLVQILSQIQWDRIDPELLETRDSLQAVQRQLDQLDAHRDEDGYVDAQSDDDVEISKARVVEIIERLEAFVTSPRFQFYEQAASEKRT